MKNYSLMLMGICITQWLPYRQDGTVDDELTVPSRIYVLIYGNLHTHFRFRYRCFYNVRAVPFRFEILA